MSVPELDGDGFCRRCQQQEDWCRCRRPPGDRDARRERELRAVAADLEPAPLPPEPPPDHDEPTKPDLRGQGSVARSPALTFLTFADLAARVDAAGPRRWLLRGLWPAGEHGVHSADAKAQKTWSAVDLAVSVASATPWLGAVPVDEPGPVIMFVGETGEAETVRRVRAIAAARDVVPEALPLIVCTRAPRLSDAAHLGLLAEQLEANRPALVTIDPLYLAAHGGDLRDLFSMGALLDGPRQLCTATGTAMFVVHHNNRAGRSTGAGPEQWGRVLIEGSVIARRTDPATRETTVITRLAVRGGEVPDRLLRVQRRIRAEDPDDLASALVVITDARDDDEGETTAGEHGASPGDQRMAPAARKVLQALDAATKPLTVGQIGDAIAARHGTGLKRQTMSTHLNELHRAGLVTPAEDAEGLFPGRVWSIVRADAGQSVAADTAPPLTSVSNPSATASVTGVSGVSAPTGRADTADTPADTWRVSGHPIDDPEEDPTDVR